MKSLGKGLAIALIHLAIVASLGAKMLYDRAHCPRVWVKTMSYDPDLPIRGRYLTAQLEVVYPEAPVKEFYFDRVRLSVVDGQLRATRDPASNVDVQRWMRRDNTASPPVIREPVAFFLPEHYDTSRLFGRDQELWMEVTVPRIGPPRPLRLGIKKNDKLEPVDIR